MEYNDYELPFRLLEGEQIIEAIKPLPNLKWYFFIVVAISLWFVILFLGLFFAFFAFPMISLMAVHFAGASLLGFAVFLVFLASFIGYFILCYILAYLQYNKRFYWITNKRIIIKRGLIGHSINSIPFERISDVIVTRSFLERILGFGSVYIQTLAGQYSYRIGGMYGAEGCLQAVPDPEELQKKIFDLIKKKRESEHLAM